MATQQEIYHLKELAHDMRVKLLTLCGTYGGVLHIGGDLSMTDLMIAIYNYGLNVDSSDIALPTRDRFVLSKGHGAMAMYTAMSYKGFFNYDDIVKTYGKLDSAYGMHPCKVRLPGVETSSGSLGHGLSIAVGMAISAKQKKQNHRVFCYMGDGETCEGSIWEAAMAAHAKDLGNLIGVIDRNKQMMTSFSEESMKMDPYPDKWKAFGWDVTEIDGHNMEEIVNALDHLKKPNETDKPQAIVANTVKGKGVSFMERNIGWHAGMLSEEDMNKALKDVNDAWDKERGAK
ncbi:MAG: transketolase [Peptococcaceae bacterium]|jgi:transketolase|nr:transketolase [Peptococcaceae bacterium]